MKKFILTLALILSLAVSANAMSYDQARDQALFLTDKMAYELNLTEDQYEAAYEVNLDYLMSINTYDDLYGAYWRNRNLDLSYILLDWQYRAFCAANYFYRPLYWNAGVWHFAIYSRYPHRNYFYFGRPQFYATYRGTHSWHFNEGHSWYKGRDFNRGFIDRGHGMKDRFDRGDFRPNRPDRGFNRPDSRGFDRPNNGNRGDFNRPNRGFEHPNNGKDNGFKQPNFGVELPNSNNNGNFNRPGNNGFNRPNNSNNRGFNQIKSISGPNMQVQRSSTYKPSTPRLNRESSTRLTARPSNSYNNNNFNRSNQVNVPSRPNNTFTPRSSSTMSSPSAPSRSFGGNNGGNGSFSKGNNGGSNHFGGGRR